MANFIMYGYKKDEDFALLSLRALARIAKPGEKVYFLDDSFEPVESKDLLDYIAETDSLVYERTYHPRRGNLIGPEHCKANFEMLYKYACMAQDEVCVKVDCDTMVFDRRWLDAFIADERYQLAGGFHSQINYMFGLCYAIKKDLARRLLSDAVKNPPWVHCFEDYEISQRVHAWDPTIIKRYQLAKPKDSFWMCLNPSELPQNTRVDVLDVNRGAPRSEVIGIMKETLNQAIALDKQRKVNKDENTNKNDVEESKTVSEDDSETVS